MDFNKIQNFSKNINITFRVFFPFIFVFYFIFNPLSLKSVEASSTIKNDKLIERISKDYTNKFCNSLAFGLSEDSAMNFAYKENKLIFKNRKGMESINKDMIANEIAISVIEDCGYLINLKGDQGINEFEKKYISIEGNISSKN